MKIPARYRKTPEQMTMIHQSLGDHVLDTAFGLPYSVHGQKPCTQRFTSMLLDQLVP